MPTLYRHGDPRFPFLWETPDQGAGRWNAAGDGPAQYFADTPNGAWAEFLRHEEIKTPEDLEHVRRAMWAVDVPDEAFEVPTLPPDVMTGNPRSYPECQAEARRLRDDGHRRLHAPSAALVPGGATGMRVDGGLVPADRRDGLVVVLFGSRTDLVGWLATYQGRPAESLLEQVRHFS